MKKHNFKKLALLGLSTGLLIISHSTINAADASKIAEAPAEVENDGYPKMSEQELKALLDAKTLKMYNEMSPKEKELAIDVASQICSGNNECKGLNSCNTDKNDCAGKGSCKGQTKCAIADKNLAVKLAHDRIESEKREMETKRSSLMN